MRIIKITSSVLLALALPLMGACSEQSPQVHKATSSADSPKKQELKLTVYKDKNCGCCKGWIEHIHQSDINTKAIDADDMGLIKSQYQIKPNQRSCHTAVSANGFVFEGHVPAKFIKQFLSEKHPAHIIGLTVPAMPLGTPGMEMGDAFHKYNIEFITTNTTTGVYKHISQYDEQF
ncbi:MULTISPECIES: DUF411 domain-containing protein [unclassified Pseudoalteromonas]|uniref:DUF411 domain-containing protein n=1 Tax=unclassified Pseudoalteromonas TaxID=194690 RepID=UPI0015FCD0FE|nr:MULTISPECIES: DUF411 domain-containing protein [unclassified Pseudoalteromonas]MBB1371906.1 DUF411 domain-containing protein [Pseudoalteromonas sp. SR45-4]MBO7927582.1 DUF411 domain-containing protein [Pseudoalteromonas sp. K222D]